MKSGATLAARGAREEIEQTRLRRERDRCYAELGRAAYALLEENTIADRRLEPAVAAVRAAEAQFAVAGGKR